MKRGRPPITKTVPIVKILAAYKNFGSLNATAKALHISKKTLRKHLKAQGISTGVPIFYFKPESSYHYGCVAQWIREHPKEKLPSSTKALAEKTGCSYNAVRSYLFRRRRKVRDSAREIVRYLRYLPTVRMVDVDGTHFQTNDATTYDIDYEPYSYEANLAVRNGDDTHLVRIKDMRKVIEHLRRHPMSEGEDIHDESAGQ